MYSNRYLPSGPYFHRPGDPPLAETSVIRQHYPKTEGMPHSQPKQQPIHHYPYEGNIDPSVRVKKVQAVDRQSGMHTARNTQSHDLFTFVANESEWINLIWPKTVSLAELGKVFEEWVRFQRKTCDFRLQYYKKKAGSGWRYADYYYYPDNEEYEGMMEDEYDDPYYYNNDDRYDDWYSYYYNNDGTAYDDWYWYPDNYDELYGGGEGDGEQKKEEGEAKQNLDADGEEEDNQMEEEEEGEQKPEEKEEGEQKPAVIPQPPAGQEPKKEEKEIQPDWKTVGSETKAVVVAFNKWSKYCTTAIRQQSVEIKKVDQCPIILRYLSALAGLFDKENPSTKIVFDGVSAFN